MGCFFWKKCKDCENSDGKEESFKEYKILRQMDRNKLHTRYISCIAGGIVIWLIATGTYSNPNFPDWVSFASTITSIILSVLAIIMSITGESKTDAIKSDLSETARKLDEITAQMDKNMSGTNEEIRELITELSNQIEILQDKVDKVPERVNTYSKTNWAVPPSTASRMFKTNIGWGTNNER